MTSLIRKTVPAFLLILSSTVALSGAAAAAVPPETLAAIGSKKDGWTPKCLAKLKHGMKPEQAGQVVPGAEKISEYGFSTVPVTDIPGIVAYEFYFAKNKAGTPIDLQSVKIHFDESAEFDELVKICVAKYGRIKDKGAVEKQLVIWINHSLRLATLSKSHEKGAKYSLDIKM
jgi:hypothetical protein